MDGPDEWRDEWLDDDKYDFEIDSTVAPDVDWTKKLTDKILADLSVFAIEGRDAQSLRHTFHLMLEDFALHLAGEGLGQAGCDASFYVSKHLE